MGMTNMNTNDPTGGAGCEGLCLHLNEEQIKALGLDKHLPADGAKVSIRAIATVRRADADDAKGADDEQAEGAQPESANESEEGGATLELHITNMEVAQNGREPASVLYGGMKG